MKVKYQVFLYISFFLVVFVVNVNASSEIPSCLEIANKMSAPGASEKCAPIIIDNDIAFKSLNNPSIKKIGFDRYLFISEDDLKNTAPKTLWKVLVLIVSSVQSLHDENADVYIALRPKTETDEMLLALGQYPEKYIKAHARYVMPKIVFPADPGKKVFPSGHHERTYVLIVY